jgi:mannan polymerase II complex ANP1 subunit
MHYSVVGLPHYTIWHLYEPSVDDIRHMEVSFCQAVLIFLCHTNPFQQEMEQERLAREKEEEEKKRKAAKIKEEFSDTDTQWQKDKQAMEDLKLQPQPAAKVVRPAKAAEADNPENKGAVKKAGAAQAANPGDAGVVA